MSLFRVVFLGTPDFAVSSLDAIIKDEHFDIAGVVTQPDRPAGRKMQLKASPVKELALRYDLRCFCPENINDPRFLNELKSLRADMAIVVAFGQILSQAFFDLFPYGAVNLHGSILPRWRGAAPIQRALMAGDAETGVTLQKMVLKLDAGDVLGVRRLKLTDEMDADSVYHSLMNLGADLLCLELLDHLRGNLVGEPQNEAQVTIAKKIRKEEGLIDWSKSAREILNQYRGLTIWPGTWTSRNGKTLKIFSVKVVSDRSGRPGEILDIHPDHVLVACGEGALAIFELQPESRAKMKFAEYQKGYTLQKGEILGS